MAMASLEWRWATVLVVSVTYFAMGLIWLPPPWGCHRTSASAEPPEGTFFEHEMDFGRHLNVSSSISFPLNCEEFLLEGAVASSEESHEGRPSLDLMTKYLDTLMPVQGWSGGEWFYPQSESSLFWTQLQRMLGRDEDVVEHEVSFAVKQTAPESWLRWSSQSNLRPQIQAVEGRLELRNIWDWIRGMEPAMAQAPPRAEVMDFNQMTLVMRNLEVWLKGGLVNKGGERRVCMTGCAYRHDQESRIDCGFVLKMTYPNRGTTSTPSRQIQAELSSSSWSGEPDPLNFPAVRIMGPTRPLTLEPEYLYNKYRISQQEKNLTV